jgi:tRNA threonylcarbamoyladenosine biosynthesis protein TsaE
MNDVVLLSGPPGAGKTWFTKGIAVALGVKDLVNSPSFSLINEYQGALRLYHFDLYRLNGCEDVAALGCSEYFEAGGVCVVEWPERCPQLFPEEALKVTLEITGPNERVLTLPDSWKRI